jgi:hypothetical protein
MSDDNQQMEADEFTRAQFFSSVADVAAAHTALAARVARRRSRRELADLARLTRSLEAQSPAAQRAAIRWLADRFHVTLP